MGDRKVHNRKQTIDGIEQAIEQLQASQGKLSISAVAKMAGVTPALIHNTYPDLAEKIRGLVGKATRTQRDAKHSALVREREINRTLRKELVETRATIAKLASVNQTLLNEMAVLKGIATGKVVAILRAREPSSESSPR
ncbi:MAG: TetR family transcriptional regulator [Spirochaetia bacterium]|jgi:AcrR family transcriptional regulator|nr:MAG: TetR family transcriptional regulator [Dechloromonas sp.]MDX9784701.1 TetR family transcriptional regulator [Spirochaetia bacterium]